MSKNTELSASAILHDPRVDHNTRANALRVASEYMACCVATVLGIPGAGNWAERLGEEHGEAAAEIAKLLTPPDADKPTHDPVKEAAEIAAIPVLPTEYFRQYIGSMNFAGIRFAYRIVTGKKMSDTSSFAAIAQGLNRAGHGTIMTMIDRLMRKRDIPADMSFVSFAAALTDDFTNPWTDLYPSLSTLRDMNS